MQVTPPILGEVGEEQLGQMCLASAICFAAGLCDYVRFPRFAAFKCAFAITCFLDLRCSVHMRLHAFPALQRSSAHMRLLAFSARVAVCTCKFVRFCDFVCQACQTRMLERADAYAISCVSEIPCVL